MGEQKLEPVRVHRAAEGQVVEVLEEWLERAKRGEILAVALAGALPSGQSLGAYRCPDKGMAQLNLALDFVKVLLVRSELEGAEIKDR